MYALSKSSSIIEEMEAKVLVDKFNHHNNCISNGSKDMLVVKQEN